MRESRTYGSVRAKPNGGATRPFPLVALLATTMALFALHFLAWKSGMLAHFGGSAVLWVLVLVPVAIVGVVTLVQNAATKKQPLWTGLGFALLVAAALAIGYLWWILAGV